MLCRILFMIMLRVIMLNATMLSVIILSVVGPVQAVGKLGPFDLIKLRPCLLRTNTVVLMLFSIVPNALF
jgi:hypothetical protein